MFSLKKISKLIVIIIVFSLFFLFLFNKLFSKTLTIYPTDDAFVSENKDNNWGNEKNLYADYYPSTVVSFIKFRLPLFYKKPKHVYLNLTTANFLEATSSASGKIYTVNNNDWSEKKINWNNKPVVDGDYLGTVTSNLMFPNTSFKIDISDFFTKTKPANYLTIAITTDNADAVVYNSKESKVGKPSLTIAYHNLPPEYLIKPLITKINPDSASIIWAANERKPLELVFGDKKRNLSKTANVTEIEINTEITNYSNNIYLYQVKFLDLKPNTKYYYKIIYKQKNFLDSEIFHFFTAPDKKINKFTSSIIGDYGNNTKNKLLNLEMISKENSNLVISLGDGVVSKSSIDYWLTSFFSFTNNLLASNVPFLTVPGNHDVDLTIPRPKFDGKSSFYETFFGDFYSPSQLYYDVEYGPALLLFLDSNNFDNEKMLDWFKKKLENNNSNKWVIAFWHHPFYTCSSYYDEKDIAILETSRPYIKALAEAGGGIIINGHQHYFCKSKIIQIKDNPDWYNEFKDDQTILPETKNNHDIYNFTNGDLINFVAGGGGDKLMDPNKSFWTMQSSKKEHHILNLSVSECQIEIKAISPNGNIIDKSKIIKC
jgi:hypothetical protein